MSKLLQMERDMWRALLNSTSRNQPNLRVQAVGMGHGQQPMLEVLTRGGLLAVVEPLKHYGNLGECFKITFKGGAWGDLSRQCLRRTLALAQGFHVTRVGGSMIFTSPAPYPVSVRHTLETLRTEGLSILVRLEAVECALVSSRSK